MAQYVYDRLNPDAREIRLLDIHPSPQRGEPLRCDLRLVALPSCEPYTALSYVWGDARITVTAEIDGFERQLTTNLDNALRYIRHPSQIQVFWVDAVCINQDDEEERGQQVALMAEIFNRAERVVAWLGEEADDSTLAMDMIEKFSGCFLAHQNEGINPGDGLNEIDNAFEPDVWTALQRLFDRPWWTRLWIYQEVVLAREVKLLCGDKRIDWQQLHQAYAIWSAIMLPRNAGYLHIRLSGQVLGVLDSPFLMSLINDRGRKLYGIQFSMMSLLRNSINRESTDPRDRIFAIMGLAHDAADFGKPNYHKSAEDVFAEFAKTIIVRDNSLDILSYSRSGIITPEAGSSPRIRLDKLPSWVPHWIWGREMSRIAPEFYNSTPSSTAAFRFEPDGKLFVRGAIIDRINRVEQPPFLHPHKHRWINAALEGGADSLYLTGIPRLQALFRLLLTDRDGATGARLGTVPETLFNLACAFLFLLPAHTANPGYLIEPEAVEIQGKPDYILALRSFVGQAAAELSDRAMFDRYFGTDVSLPEPEVDKLRGRRHTKQYAIDEARSTRFRRLFFTEKGYMGLSPSNIEVGDDVCLVLGCPMPLTLRRRQQQFLHLGECFVLGLMDGEGLKIMGDGEGQVPLMELCLV